MKGIIKRIGMLAVMLQASLAVLAYDFEVDGIYYNVVSLQNLTCKVTYGDKDYVGDITIPSTVEYNTRNFTVVKIGYSAFYYCSDLTSVVFPEGLTSIESEAFWICDGLTSVTFPEGLTTIGYGAFYDCDGLTSVTFPEGLTTIGYEAFWNCDGLTSVVFPGSLTNIEESAFSGCTGLTSVEFEEGSLQVDLGDFVFHECSNLEQVILPRLCKMGYNINGDNFDYFFYRNLKYLKVGSLGCCYYKNNQIFSIKKIETMELDNVVWSDHSYGLHEIEVDNLIFSENYCAEKPELKGFTARSSFEFDFSDLKTLVSKTLEPPVIPGNVSNKSLMNTEVQVPIEALEKYQQAPVWKDFWNLKGVEKFEDINGIESAEVLPAKEIGRYDLTGKTVSKDYHGIVIVRYSDGSTSKMVQR